MSTHLLSPDQTLLVRLFPIYSPSYVVHEMDDAHFDGVRDLTFNMDYSSEIHAVWVEGGAPLTWLGADIFGTWPLQGWVTVDPKWSWPGPVNDPYGAPEAVLSDDGICLPGMHVGFGRRLMKRTYYGILRGKMTIGCEHWHPDGWRVGNYILLSDERLPAFLRGRTVCIQKVVTKLIPTVDWRVYEIEWGDAPQGRLTSVRPKETKKEDTGSRAYSTGTRYWAGDIPYTAFDSETVLITGQLIQPDGIARRISGVKCYLAILAWSPDGTLTTAPVDVSLDPVMVTTDIRGRWETYLHVGANINWSFQVIAAGQVPPSGAW